MLNKLEQNFSKNLSKKLYNACHKLLSNFIYKTNTYNGVLISSKD